MSPCGEVRNLNAVAKEADVSAMTVSRVLRKSPRVSESTRRRVMAAVRRLGYTPDPYISRLMEQVRSHRRHRTEATIAIIRDFHESDHLLDPAYHYTTTTEINRCAARYGYRAEEFRLDRAKMSPARLRHILESRGIEGVLVSPQSFQSVGCEIDYNGLAAVTLGYGLPHPALHRASTNMTRGILQAARHLDALGYKRIGVAVTEWIDVRADHTYTGAMLTYQQQIKPSQRVPLLLFPENNLASEEAIFCSWYRNHRPDVIISFDSYVPQWLTNTLGLSIPRDVGLVVHDWENSSDNYAGINHRRADVVAAAVDLLATQLLQNERGIPAVARQVLIEPAWVDGRSIRTIR